MNLLIQGLGIAVPEHSIRQADAAEIAKTFIYGDGDNVSALPRLYRLTKVETRRSVLLESSNGDRSPQSFYPPAVADDDRGPATGRRMKRYAEEATPLAVGASRNALLEADVKSDEITHLITVSCTGFHAPGVDVGLIEQLELSPSVNRLNVGFMGCHGAFNGLSAAQSFAAANSSARVLVCCVELCTLHYSYGWDSEKVVANALFADGASALVGKHATGQEDEKSWSLAACGSFLIPDSADAMTWTIGDHGFEMTLSNRVPDLIQRHVKPWIVPWLGRRDHSVDQIKSWAIHPGGPRIIRSVAQALDLPREATQPAHQVLGKYGNMSSATVLFVIKELVEQGAELPCVAIGFGPGLVAEVMLFV